MTLHLKPVSQFKIDTLRTSKEDLPAPTYEAKVAGGASLFVPLDEESARNKGRLEEWNAFVEQRKISEAAHAKKFLELMIWEGVDVEVPGTDSEWQTTSDYFGIKVPENPIERKLFYVYNELLGTPEDIGDLISQIFSVSQIDEAAVAKLRASFRSGAPRPTYQRVSKKQRKLEGLKSDI